MSYSELMDWQSVFEDVNCVRALLYLAKYNPNTQTMDLQKTLSLNSNELDVVLNKLINAKLVFFKDDSLTLKDSALIALDNFVNLTGLTKKAVLA